MSNIRLCSLSSINAHTISYTTQLPNLAQKSPMARQRIHGVKRPHPRWQGSQGSHLGQDIASVLVMTEQ